MLFPQSPFRRLAGQLCLNCCLLDRLARQWFAAVGKRAIVHSKVLPPPEPPPASRHMLDPDRNLLALGIRQPWAELILRGIKTLEIRTVPTTVRGIIYIYASKNLSDLPAAEIAVAEHGLHLPELPTNRIIGTVQITGCRPCTAADAAAALVPWEVLSGKQAWELTSPVRLAEPLAPRFRPYGIWFYPFRRRSQG